MRSQNLRRFPPYNDPVVYQHGLKLAKYTLGHAGIITYGISGPVTRPGVAWFNLRENIFTRPKKRKRHFHVLMVDCRLFSKSDLNV